jgi:diphthine-ammonia ligase
MKECFCSWSGGKDSCLALYRAMKMGYVPKFLLTTCIEQENRSRSHGLSAEVLQAQAKSLNLPLILCNTSWSNYRENFINKLTETKKLFPGVSAGVFGDIDIEDHRKWVQEVCLDINYESLLPLWKCERKEVIAEFLRLGFSANIVAIDSKKLTPAYLDRMIDMDILEDFTNKGVDPCGENGEFHTVVTDGPLFTKPVNIKKCGEPVLHSGYWFQDFSVNT